MITEKQYLEYLIKQYQNLIYSICLKSIGNPFDAEDLTQEVFLSAYKNLSRFDGTYEKAWLSKIAVLSTFIYSFPYSSNNISLSNPSSLR